MIKRTFHANEDEINKWMLEFVDTFDFTLEVGSRMLAEEIRDLIALMIRQRSINFQMGATEVWRDNEPIYKQWKLDNYGAAHVGELTGQMLSLESLKGVVVITRDEMTMYYGVDQPADRFKTQAVRSPGTYGVYQQGARFGRRRKARKSKRPKRVKKQAVPPTDTQKGQWFTDGDPKRNRPRRPFYELDDRIEEAVHEIIEEFLDDLLA